MSWAISRARAGNRRRGTTAIEAAFVMPIFVTLVFGIMQVCHAQMIEYVLKSACRNGARYGSAGTITTAQTLSKVQQILACAVDPTKVTIQIKNGDVYDASGTLPTTSAAYQALPDIELSDADPRQMFLVRATVSYNDVAILTLPYCSGLIISAEAIIRHE